MTHTKMAFMQRLALAWRLLFNSDVAKNISALQLEENNPDRRKALSAAQTPPQSTASTEDWSELQSGAAQVLALLQREGRFVDFISEDISSFADAEVGAAARAVHQGCAKVFAQHLQLAAIRSEAEGAQLNIEAGFDPTRLSLSGQVQGAPPYQGHLLHPGWELKDIKLPERQGSTQSLRVIAAAEVEI